MEMGAGRRPHMCSCTQRMGSVQKHLLRVRYLYNPSLFPPLVAALLLHPAAFPVRHTSPLPVRQTKADRAASLSSSEARSTAPTLSSRMTDRAAGAHGKGGARSVE